MSLSRRNWLLTFVFSRCALKAVVSHEENDKRELAGFVN